MADMSYRRLLRARIEPLTVTAATPGGVGTLRLDAELLWAACLVEFEEVEVRFRDGHCWRGPVMAGEAGEVEMVGDFGGHAVPGDLVAVSAFAYRADANEEEVHLVEVGEGNRAVELRRQRARSFPTHPSYAAPVGAETGAVVP